MVTIDHECYVDLEVAKLLKEAGFDWSCRGYYDRQILRFNFVWDHNGKGASTQCSAPTLDVAQRWLREVKSIEAVPWRWPTKVLFVSGYKPWSYKLIEYRDLEGVDIEDFNASGEDYFKTYEEAQEAGIQKVLEMILQIANAE
jgi:hypothetical protein